MQTLETLTIDDMMQIFRLSRISVYRRLRTAREGRGGLPLPIPTGTKQRLRWNAETVRKFLENADSTPQMPTPIESTAKRETRHRAALRELEKSESKFHQRDRINNREKTVLILKRTSNSTITMLQTQSTPSGLSCTKSGKYHFEIFSILCNNPNLFFCL